MVRMANHPTKKELIKTHGSNQDYLICHIILLVIGQGCRKIYKPWFISVACPQLIAQKGNMETTLALVLML